MRMPNIGDEYISARNSDTRVGKALTWRVTRFAKKSDSAYVELQAVNAQLPKKLLSVRALRDTRLFSRVES
jgi:hypothetical protein